jgi:hypothetical protein
MSAQIISFAAFRLRRELEAPDGTRALHIGRADPARTRRDIAASLERVRRQALLLHRARCLREFGE